MMTIDKIVDIIDKNDDVVVYFGDDARLFARVLRQHTSQKFSNEIKRNWPMEGLMIHFRNGFYLAWNFSDNIARVNRRYPRSVIIDASNKKGVVA